MSFKSKFEFGGPGALVAAAFIGPGTVTVCTLAGARHGLQLLWAVGLSIFMTLLFQEMSARLGIVTQLDLTSLVKQKIANPVLKGLVLAVVLASIVIGNGAYEAGNISGGALGLQTFISTRTLTFHWLPVLIGASSFLLLWFGNSSLLEKSLATLVGVMSIAFITSAVLIRPNIVELLNGLFIPKIPENGQLIVLGVIGTTIVPYNLFLHASLAKEKWRNSSDLSSARKDTILSILIGGLISMAIVISASSLQGEEINNALDLGKGLESTFGSFARYLISIGFLAAGITSAITAPLAAAYVMSGGFGWNADRFDWRFRTTWALILGVGVLFSSLGFKPIDVIRFAQVCNGLLLPLIGFLLVWLSSRSSILGIYKNKKITTIVSSILLILIATIGIKSILAAFI